MDELKMKIQEASELIDGSRYREAENLLAELVSKNISSPEIYNLFGILSEYKGDYAQAAKFFRVSFDFDPAYKPAEANLMRVTAFSGSTVNKPADFGRTSEFGGADGQYIIEYDEENIGHIRKKTRKAE